MEVPPNPMSVHLHESCGQQLFERGRDGINKVWKGIPRYWAAQKRPWR